MAVRGVCEKGGFECLEGDSTRFGDSEVEESPAGREGEMARL
jgi:hypothetical protein